MGILSFSEQTASVDRNQACEKWTDVKVSRVLDVRAGSPHHERLRAGWEAHTTREHVRAGSQHYERLRAGWEAHTTKDRVRAGKPTPREITCDTDEPIKKAPD
jgi:hypothetical protein